MVLHFCLAGECGYGAKLPRRKPNRVDLNFGRQLVDRGDHPEKGKNKDPHVDRLRLRGQHLVQRANILLPGLTDNKEPKKRTAKNKVVAKISILLAVSLESAWSAGPLSGKQLLLLPAHRLEQVAVPLLDTDAISHTNANKQTETKTNTLLHTNANTQKHTQVIY